MRAQLLELLESIEWARPCETRHYIGPLEPWDSCPSCRAEKSHPRVESVLAGHRPDCKLAAALAMLRTEAAKP